MVGLAVAGRAPAGGEGTALVAFAEGVAQRGGGQALLAPDVQGHRITAQHHGDDPGIAGQPAGLGGGELPAGVQGRGPEPGDQFSQAHGEHQVRALPTTGGQLAVVEQPAHRLHQRVGITARGPAGISYPIDGGTAAAERTQHFEYPGTALRVELPGEADRAVGPGADPQLPPLLGFLDGPGAARVQMSQQPLTDPGQSSGTEPAGGAGQGLLGLRDRIGMYARRDPTHG